MSRTPHAAQQITVTGQVQGVGFRPFVYRLAHQYGLGGWVQNCQGQVRIWAEGDSASLEAFTRALVEQAPPLAAPALSQQKPVTAERHKEFIIRDSTATGRADIHVPSDQFTCDACLQELNDPHDRRYHYPFINCTQCGPRYTLIEKLPYDRPNTSMAAFPLCPTCLAEYRDPADRRFHAEPVACPECGPQLQYRQDAMQLDDTSAALQQCLSDLREGKVVAVKGIGGYHLLCDAYNNDAVVRLRERKGRPDKPLAVLFPFTGPQGMGAIEQTLRPTPIEVQALAAAQRPIVLCRKREDSPLSPAIAPGLDEVGAMLPYSPLHHLLLAAFDGPLVATSGNISGEPVITSEQEAEQRLAAVADAFLHHNRPILRPADDAVLRVIGEKNRAIRLGRGSAPLELPLPGRIEVPTLATGGQMKNCIALAWDRRIVIAPHIGNLDSPRSLTIFEQVIDDLQRLYGVQAEQVVCDAHPGYASSRWARESGLPTREVFHHHAHASAVYGEHAGKGDWLVFAWDGVGYGPDGTLWGGEVLLGRPGQWQRFASLRPFHLAGGDRAGREPWRSALALCWEVGIAWEEAPPQGELLQQAWCRGINRSTTSAAGRLFDGAAALLGLCHTASFEGQGPMRLEALATQQELGEEIALPIQADAAGHYTVDWSPLLPMLLNARASRQYRARTFHASLAHTIAALATLARERHGIAGIGFAGGVFQNRLLYQLGTHALSTAGFTTHLPIRIPANDGGLSYGQIVEICQPGHEIK